MAELKTLTYDDVSSGRKVITFPPDMPFYSHLEEFEHISHLGGSKDALLNLSDSANLFERSRDLCSYLSLSEKPYLELLRIAASAVLGEPGGLRLLYTLMLAIPPKEIFIRDLIGFSSTRRIMRRISLRESSGEQLTEGEEWFKKKVMMLSISMPLPGTPEANADEPWLDWEGGVRRAIADLDDRWDQAVAERAKVELDAMDMRIRKIIASSDPEMKHALISSLGAVSEDLRAKRQILEDTAGSRGEPLLFLMKSLGSGWEETLAMLKKSKAGALLASMLETQQRKAHSYQQIRNGTAVLRALIMHPALQRTSKAPDILSCLYHVVTSAGEGRLDLMLPLGKKVPGIEDVAGFSIQERILSIELSRVESGTFSNNDDEPVQVDWMETGRSKSLTYKYLVMSYIDNESFLAQLLNNAKATSKVGIVSLIAQRCRSMRVLSMIANRRDLYTGFANKDVPVSLVTSPAKIPLTSLRKFIHVRYIDKMSLVRLAQKGGGHVREEVRREIERYLNNSK